MDEKVEKSPDVEMVQKCLEVLGEHFDSVHIFCTRHESGQSGGTHNVNKGTGNWYARYGQIRTWMHTQDERERMIAHEED